MDEPTLVDFEAMNLTPEQNRLALLFFDKIVTMVQTDELPPTRDKGIGLCVALTEFLAAGVKSGLATSFLSEEHARVLVSALSNQLPKPS